MTKELLLERFLEKKERLNAWMAQKLSGILRKTIEYPPMVLLPYIVSVKPGGLEHWFSIFSDWGITKLVSWDKKVAQGVLPLP